MVVVMVYYIYYERSYFSLSFDVHVILKGRKLRFSVCILKDLLKGSLSQIFDLGPSFHFMTKNG